MNKPNFTDHMVDHLANRQRPQGIPEHQLDQIDAAALDGARAVDSAAFTAGQSGLDVQRSAASPDVFNRLGERFTQSLACKHLAARPLQPRYLYGAAPDRVFCEDCLTGFFLDNRDAFGDYDSSTKCDACGSESKAETPHIGTFSNGMVTYVTVTICSDCMATGT